MFEKEFFIQVGSYEKKCSNECCMNYDCNDIDPSTKDVCVEGK